MESIKNELTGEYLAILSNMRIDSINRINRINSGYGGERKSNSRGSSLEFSDFKDYTPGDDGNRIDWNSYSRLNRLYVKMFEEEKRANINFFIDTSKSMGFGEFSKLRFAKLFAASMSYISLKDSDAVNILAYDDAPRSIKRGIFSSSQFPGIVEFLDSIKPSGKTKINYVISSELSRQPFNVLPGISFVISDFFDKEGCENAIKYLQSKKQEVRVIHVLAKEEILPDFSADISDKALRLTDSETNEAVELYVTSDIISLYSKALSEFSSELNSFCVKRGVRYSFVSSDTNVLKMLS